MDLLEKKKYKKAIKFLNSSKEWPENLGSGKPYEPDIRLQDYIAAHCEIQLGKLKSAEQYYQQIIDFSRKVWSDTKDPAGIFLATSVLNTRGYHQESAALIKEWEIKQDSLRDWRISGGLSSTGQWVLAKYKNQEEKAQKLEAGILAEQSATSKFCIFLRAYTLMGREP